MGLTIEEKKIIFDIIKLLMNRFRHNSKALQAITIVLKEINKQNATFKVINKQLLDINKLYTNYPNGLLNTIPEEPTVRFKLNNGPSRQSGSRSFSTRNTSRQTATRQTATRQNVARQNVARQNVARQNVARQNVARQNVARQSVARQRSAFGRGLSKTVTLKK